MRLHRASLVNLSARKRKQSSARPLLIVDDDQIVVYLADKLFDRCFPELQLMRAGNGREAINFLNKSSKNYPEVILLDVNMPLVNGFEFLDWFHKEHQPPAGLPFAKITVFSTAMRSEERKRSLAYEHVADYIEKPLTEDKIRNRIGVLLPGVPS